MRVTPSLGVPPTIDTGAPPTSTPSPSLPDPGTLGAETQAMMDVDVEIGATGRVEPCAR